MLAEIEALSIDEQIAYWQRRVSTEMPPKENAEHYIHWLENRALCLSHLMVLERRRNALMQVVPKSTKPRFKDTQGYVYLLKMVNGGHYKIGRTRKPQNRLEVFGVKLPFPVEYECLIATRDMYQLERDLHQRFAAQRVNGEWFLLSSQDIEYIKSL